jgi:hypothetical protein
MVAPRISLNHVLAAWTDLPLRLHGNVHNSLDVLVHGAPSFVLFVLAASAGLAGAQRTSSDIGLHVLRSDPDGALSVATVCSIGAV